jgi:hypothetical protein
MPDINFHETPMAQILDVISYCEETNHKVRDMQTGHFTGFKEIGNIVLWVEYEVQAGEPFPLSSYYNHTKFSGKTTEASADDIRSRQEYIDLSQRSLMCCKCNIPLKIMKVNFDYLKVGYLGPGMVCPSCQQLYLTEQIVILQRDAIERLLESK